MDETPWDETAEAALLDAMLAAKGPWGRARFESARAAAGFSAADARLLCPEGPRDLIALLFARHDRAALARLAGVDPRALKVRERIFAGAHARIEAAAADAEAARAGALFLARPDNAPLGARLLWRSADVVWRWAGDAATDENHYSKRAILSGVLAAASAARLSRGPEAGEAELRARIENVMAFEKLKARLPRPSAALADLAARAGRLRYRGVSAPDPEPGPAD